MATPKYMQEGEKHAGGALVRSCTGIANDVGVGAPSSLRLLAAS